MKNSKFVIDKIAKLFEQGLISSKDLATELITISSVAWIWQWTKRMLVVVV